MIRSRKIDPFFLPNKVAREWNRIYLDSVESNVPIMGTGAAEILMDTMLLKRPAKVLEIGTGFGYSTYILFSSMNKPGKIYTIESNRKRYNMACDSFLRSSVTDWVIPILGDAVEVCRGFNKYEFDLIFIDAQKSSYCAYLDVIEDLLAPKGLIVADDVFFHADRGEGYFPRIHRNTVNGLEQYRERIVNNPWRSILFHVEDGISITWKAGGLDDGKKA